MLHCDGKCVLAKRLKQQENKEQQNPELKLSAKNEVLSSRSFFISPFFTQPLLNKNYFISSDNRTINMAFTICHPPCS